MTDSHQQQCHPRDGALGRGGRRSGPQRGRQVGLELVDTEVRLLELGALTSYDDQRTRRETERGEQRHGEQHERDRHGRRAYGVRGPGRQTPRASCSASSSSPE